MRELLLFRKLEKRAKAKGKGINVSNLNAKEYKTFESIKHISEDGNEFWHARELASVLEYVQWRNFAKVMDRAKLACKNSGYPIPDHFAEVSKIVEAGTMPEDLPVPGKSITAIEREQLRKLKKPSKKLMLDE